MRLPAVSLRAPVRLAPVLVSGLVPDNGVSLVGSAAVPILGAGVLTARIPIAGSGAIPVTGSGAAASRQVIAGSGAIPVAGSGAVARPGALTGSGAIPVAGSGAVALRQAIAGSGAIPVAGSGAISSDLIVVNRYSNSHSIEYHDIAIDDSMTTAHHMELLHRATPGTEFAAGGEYGFLYEPLNTQDGYAIPPEFQWTWATLGIPQPAAGDVNHVSIMANNWYQFEDPWPGNTEPAVIVAQISGIVDYYNDTLGTAPQFNFYMPPSLANAFVAAPQPGTAAELAAFFDAHETGRYPQYFDEVFAAATAARPAANLVNVPLAFWEGLLIEGTALNALLPGDLWDAAEGSPGDLDRAPHQSPTGAAIRGLLMFCHEFQVLPGAVPAYTVAPNALLTANFAAIAQRALDIVQDNVTTPQGFAPIDWSAAPGPGNAELAITIVAVPDDRGAAITDLEYSTDDGVSWAGLGTVSAGAVSIALASDGAALAPSTVYDLRLRAVNAEGASIGSLSQSASSSSAGAVAPGAFTVGQWSIADLATDGDARITVSALPGDGGSPITDLEFSVDAGGFASLGGASLGAYDVAGFANGVAADVVLRAVNAVGAGPGSDVKSVTTTAPSGFDPASAGEAFFEINRSAIGAPITGLTPAAAVNTAAGTLENLGTGANDFAAGADANRGVLRAGFIEGVDAGPATGTHYIYDRATRPDAATVVMGWQPGAAAPLANARRLFSVLSTDGAAHDAFQPGMYSIEWQSTQWNVVSNGATLFSWAPPAGWEAAPHVFTLQFRTDGAGVVELFFDGVSVGSAGATGPVVTAAAPWRTGYLGRPNEGSPGGDLYAAYFTPSILSAVDRADVETYIAALL